MVHLIHNGLLKDLDTSHVFYFGTLEVSVIQNVDADFCYIIEAGAIK